MKLLEYIKRKSFLLLLLILLIAGVLRIAFIGNVPYGFANDEVSYILSGYSIASTGGYDIAGKFLPLSVNLDSSLSPVPVYILSVFIKLFSLSPLVSRLPFALMGVGIVAFVYLIAKELFKKNEIAFLSALIISLSSWHILITRGVWDVVSAQFFYLAGMYIFLKKVEKGSVLWSLPLYLLGFFSYHGTKVFFVLFAVLTILVFWKTLKKRRKEFFLFIGGLVAIFAIFGFVMAAQSVTRQTEIIFTNENAIKESSKQINFDRQKSNAPLVLRKLEDNKITFFAEKIAGKYLSAFSPNFLLLVGDIQPVYGYGIFFKGVIYYEDVLFLLAGFLYLLYPRLKNKKEGDVLSDRYGKGGLLIIGALLVSPLPSAIGAGNSYIIRSFMMVPFLSIIAGVGAYAIYSSLRKKGMKGKVLIAAAIFLYALFVTRFLYQYYYQFNTFGGEFWNSSSRELSEYINKNSSQYKNIFVVTSEDKVFFQYAFRSRAKPSDIQTAWKKDWPVKIGNVTFSNSCLKEADLLRLSGKTLYISHPDCEMPIKEIYTITDSLEPLRVIWKIYDI